MSGFTQHGGCQCGQVRYTLTARPHVVYCCHCTECQKQSSSAFGISVRVHAADVQIEGQVATFVHNGAQRDFCPSCGTRLFHRRAQYADKLNIKGGTFDDKSWLEPAGHIWVSSKLSWVILPEDSLTYEGQPDNYEALAARYRSNS